MRNWLHMLWRSSLAQVAWQLHIFSRFLLQLAIERKPVIDMPVVVPCDWGECHCPGWHVYPNHSHPLGAKLDVWYLNWLPWAPNSASCHCNGGGDLTQTLVELLPTPNDQYWAGIGLDPVTFEPKPK